MQRSIIVSLFGLIGCLVSTQAFSQAVHEYVLDNGLKLIIKEDHRAPVVSSQVWYRVGSSYEHAGITGVAHALEHMMFKGTPNYPPGEFSKIISANGGDENAFTSSDYTAYYQNLERSRLPVSFEMEADRMRHLNLDPEEFAKEIKVVMEERRWRTDDNPQALAHEQFNATIWTVSPNRNPVIGWMDDLEHLDINDLVQWYEAWYAPNNAVVVVVGDVEPSEVLALAEQHFGPLQAEDLPLRRVLKEPEQFGERRLSLHLPAKLPQVSIGYKVPSLKTAASPAEAYALEMLVYVLDGSDSARFTRELVRGEEITASASASYNLYNRLDSVLSLSAIPNDGITLGDLEEALRKQVKRLQTEPVSQQELDRIKTQIIASKVFERDALFSQGNHIGMMETIGLGYKTLDAYLPGIEAVTPERIQAVANKYLVDTKLTVATLQPTESK